MIKIKPAVATGTVPSACFWDGHDPKTGQITSGFGLKDIEVYPESPRGKAIHDLRASAWLSLGKASRLLGISAAELSGLEIGRYTTDQWDEIEKVLKDYTEE